MSSQDNKLLTALNYTYLGVITYTDNFSKEDVSTLFVNNLIGKENYLGVVVTNQIEITQNKISKIVDDDDKKSNLIFYEYSQIENIKSIVKGLIIIDDAVDFYESIKEKSTAEIIELYRTVNDNNTYLILLSDSKVTVEQMKKILYGDESKSADLFTSKPIFFTLANVYKDLEFPKIDNKSFHPVVISEVQLENIKNEPENISNSYNICYPYDVKQYIDKKTAALEEIDLSELIALFGIKNIFKYGPKIKKLNDTLHEIAKNGINEKHVIYVNTQDPYYGLTLIYDLLSKKSDIFRPLWIDKDENEEDKNEKIYAFNNAKATDENTGEVTSEDQFNVLIINCELPQIIEENADGYPINVITAKNIGHYHIVNIEEGTTQKEECINNIKKIFKDVNYDPPRAELRIHFYYNTSKYIPKFNDQFEDKSPSDKIKIYKEDYDFKKFYNEFIENFNFYVYRLRNGFEINPSDLSISE
jgi:hypothetical protein